MHLQKCIAWIIAREDWNAHSCSNVKSKIYYLTSAYFHALTNSATMHYAMLDTRYTENYALNKIEIVNLSLLYKTKSI